MKKSIFGAFILAALSLSSCSSLDGDNCPYLIANQNVIIGSSPEKYNFAGTEFSFYNASEKDVKSFTVSFMLYDSDGNNPFIGSNNIVETVKGNIKSGATQKIELSLDDYLSVVPDESPQIDFMYVRKILYADGSTWSDPYGMYAAREAVE